MTTTRPTPRHLADLDPRQREVATRPDGQLLVVAGPGAGKTRALAARIAHLVQARGIDPAGIVAFTFSRRAAAELHARVSRMDGLTLTPPHGGASPPHPDRRPPLPSTGVGPWSGTIHAFGARILRRGAAAQFERRPDFTIHDDDDTGRTVRRVLDGLGAATAGRRRSREGDVARDTGAGHPDDPVGQVVRAISHVKRTAAAVATVEVELEGTTFASAFAAYEEALRVANAFDFDDLVALACLALESDPGLRDRVRARVRHLLVDEYQDVDDAQARLVEALDPPDLCVVADPGQAIYGFRGATPEVHERFLARWPGAAVVRLDRNYRSSGRIVAVAQRVRDAAPHPPGDRARLRQWTRAAAGDPVRTWATSAPEREARVIAAEVAGRIAAGARPDEIAILVRTRAQLRPLEAVLAANDSIPFEVVGAAPFFAREEVRDVLAYLRVGASLDDAAAFWRVVNVPRRGLGPATLLAIGRETVSPAAPSRSPEAAARRLALADRLPDGAFDLLAVIDEVRARLAYGMRAGDTVRFIVEATRYLEHLEREHPDDASHRAARLNALATIGDRYDDARRLLDDAALATTVDAPRQEGGRVRVSTIHAAKGTEHDHVYVAGCEDGTLPVAPRAGASPGAGPDPEERRVFYVAITRARRSLTLSYSSFRQARRAAPSPFLGEIGAELLVRCEPGTSVPVPRRKPRLPKSERAPAPAS